MGQDLSKAYAPPPLTFHNCLVDGRIDVAKYVIYNESMIEEELLDSNELINSNKRKSCQEDSVTSVNKKKRSIK